MISKDSEVRNKIALLKLADELGSITKACDILGYSRDSYYRFKKQFEAVGPRGLKNLSRNKPALSKRASPELEEQVIEIALDYPGYGQAKAAEVLSARGVVISASGVRSIWVRHNLETKKNRLVALKAKLLQDNNLPKAEVERISSLFLVDSKNSELECFYPGDICIQDTLNLGLINPIGRIYLHTFIDAFSQYAHVLLSTNQDTASALKFLADDVLPWYRQNNIKISHILTDRGNEFSGKNASSFKDFLNSQHITHILLRAFNGPVVNGLAARFEKLTVTDFFEPYLKNNKVTSIEQLNEALQTWCTHYNNHVPLLGRYALRRTAVEILKNSTGRT